MKRAKMMITFLGMITLFTMVEADNPIIQTIYTADPAPMVHNDRVYLYTSHDEDVLVDNFFTMREWRCYSSTDMVNWTDHGVAASLKSFSWTGDNGAWAPQGIYRNGKFYLYCPIHMKGIGVLVSDYPWGPFTDPLGKPLVSGGSGDIDPTVFIDDDGQAYLYWGNPYLKYVKLNTNMTSYSGGVQEINLTVASFGKRSNTERATSYEEGPWFYKRNNLYYMVFAGGPISEHIAYSTSSSPTGPWTYRGVIMPTQGGSFTNHPGVIDFKGNSYLFYHNAALPGGGGFKRSVCIEQFKYNADGTIPTINMSKNGPAPVANLDPYDTVQAETICWESGVETAVCSEGGMMVTDISNGDYIKVKSVDFGDGASSFKVRAASGSSGGSIELRLGSQTGSLVGTCNISNTGGWTTWKTFECEVNNCSGVKDLFLVFKGSGEPFRLNWYIFDGGTGYRLSVQTSGLGSVTRSPSGSRYAEGTTVALTAVPENGWEFVGWSGDGISGSENPISIVMNADKAVTARFTRATIDGNMVINSDFSSGTENWTLNTWSGSATGSVTDGEYRISISSIANNSYDIQLVQPGLFLEKGMSYKVTFDAYASSDRDLEVNVEMADDPWTSYLDELKHFSLTTTKQTFSFVFTMEEPTDVNGRLGFNVGTSTSSVFIDNVSVKFFDPTDAVSRKAQRKQASPVKVNCSNSSLHISFTPDRSGTAALEIYDLRGKIVKTERLHIRAGEINTGSINMSRFSRGFYLIKIVSEGEVINTSEVILTR
jgi:hypothetical protein